MTSCAKWLQVINDYLLEKDGLKSAHFPDNVNSDFPSSPSSLSYKIWYSSVWFLLKLIFLTPGYPRKAGSTGRCLTPSCEAAVGIWSLNFGMLAPLAQGFSKKPHEMGRRRVKVLNWRESFCIGKKRKLEVSYKALWDLWEHHQFKNRINLNAFITLLEHRNFPEVNLIMSAHFER